MIFRAFIVLVVLVVWGCNTGRDSQDGSDASRRATTGPATKPTSTQATTFTGVLRGGMMAIGGEHTGWVLQGDGAVGGIEVDVSGMKEEAKKFDGQRVSITGRMGEKRYVERGRTPILIAERIAAAPAPKE